MGTDLTKIKRNITEKTNIKEIMGSNLRKEDERLEKVLADYLDRNLYTPQNGLYPFKRNDVNKSMQIRGVDVGFYIGEHGYFLADEKMAVRYINKDLNTFSLELRGLNRKGNEIEGWFVNPSIQNTHYVLGWITAKKESNITLEDILQVEIAIVLKENIKAYISEFFDLSSVEETYKKFQKGDSVRYINKKLNLSMDEQGFILYYSDKLFEKPLNILLKKEKYIELADKHLIV